MSARCHVATRKGPFTHDPRMLVPCRATPDSFRAQHHNGIFRSTDGARSWSEIGNATPSASGFPVAAHPDDANTSNLPPVHAVRFEKPV